MFYFHSYLGKIPILTNIFQRGRNHQLDFIVTEIGSRLQLARCHSAALDSISSERFCNDICNTKVRLWDDAR